jgi:hypothetical protein
MLSTSARRWPNGQRWMLQPKWDGFRLLVDVDAGGCVRGWSRHATNLSPRLGTLLVPFNTVAPGTTFDGELVAIGQRDGHPTEDFAAVTRAVFTGNPAATDRLSYIAFDILRAASEDLRPRPWHERDERLRDALPATNRIRMIAAQPATPAADDAIIALGFEGTVLKRPNSTYRAGRHNSWLKHKAKLATNGEVLSVIRRAGSQRAMARPLRRRRPPRPRAHRPTHPRARRTARRTRLLPNRRQRRPTGSAAHPTIALTKPEENHFSATDQAVIVVAADQPASALSRPRGHERGHVDRGQAVPDGNRRRRSQKHEPAIASPACRTPLKWAAARASQAEVQSG